IKLKLLSAGKRLLKHAGRLKLTANGSFGTPGQRPLAATQKFTLKRQGDRRVGTSRPHLSACKARRGDERCEVARREEGRSSQRLWASGSCYQRRDGQARRP